MANKGGRVASATQTLKDRIVSAWRLDTNAFKRCEEKKIKSCSFETTKFKSSWYLAIKKTHEWYDLSLYLEFSNIELYTTFQCELIDCKGQKSDEYKWTQDIWMKVHPKDDDGDDAKVWEWSFWMTEEELIRKFFIHGEILKIVFTMDLAGSKSFSMKL